MKPKDRLRVLCIVSSDTDVGDYVARIKVMSRAVLLVEDGSCVMGW